MNKFTIANFNKQFPDDNACLEWLKNSLYPDGIFCKQCGMITNHSKLSKAPIYECNRCGWHMHPMSGTIFERSHTSLKSWFYAMFLMSNTRSGVSAKQLQRELGVTYKTAWRMFKHIRTLLQDTIQKESGDFEADECYIGGRRHGKRGRGAGGKMPVFGIVQRKGEVSATKVNDLKKSTVYPLIKERVLPQSMVYTDEYPVYDKLKAQGYHHKRVNHGAKVYVSGHAHTNNIEGFWSVLKRGISGVYHAVSEKHLQSYIDEYAFRYNHRKDEQSMFLTILNKIAVS
jgi:transposase-like protein